MVLLGKARTANTKYLARELSVSEFIPYTALFNDHTVLTKDQALIQTIKLGGFSFETADDAELEIKKALRNNLLKGIASGSYQLYFHTVRRRQDIFEGQTEIPVDPNIVIPQNFITYVDKSWRDKHKHDQCYVNELYLTVIRKEELLGADILNRLTRKFKPKLSPAEKFSGLKESYEDLAELMMRLMTALRDYKPRLLGVRETEHGTYSEILEFLGKLVNCGQSGPILLPYKPIDCCLATNRLFFGGKSIEVRAHSKSKYAGVVSVKEYCPNTYAGIMDGFLQMPFEFIMTQSFEFTNRQAAIRAMQLKQGRLIQTGDKALTQIAEITQALDMAMGGEIAFGHHHLTITCIEDSPKLLENSLSLAVTQLTNVGCMPIREKTNLEAAYWGQLPGNGKYVVRKATINTMNLAGFASFHNYPTGKAKGNHWGEAVTVFNTTSGTPYYFNFHDRDIGHTLIIGPTGAGKTVLMNFLCAQAQKFNCRMFFFDKDHGAEIFIRALGGEYTVINPRAGCNFNPLSLEDTPSNRAFLLEWLTSLVVAYGDEMTAAEKAVLNSAVEGNFKLQPHDRVLRNIVPFLGIESGSNSLATRIGMWHGKGSHAGVFDNEKDNIDFTRNRIYGFEMGELLKDPLTLAPALSYLFHRVNESLDGTPTMIVLDEAWALIDNPVFAPKIKDWLKVLRKLNTMVIFATQSVEDATKSSISDTLIQQTATQIFLPNLRATEAYRSAFMVTEREFSLIKTTDPASRFFIVKQGSDAVVARIDLAGMTNIINVLSGRADTVKLLHDIIANTGDQPEAWLPVFYQEARNI